MSAEILPFPASCRRAFVQRLASYVGASAPRAAENILRARLARHADNLARKGVSSDRISADVRDLGVAVRTELLYGNFSGDGRA